MDFENKVQKYIEDQGLLSKTERVLVACSGGADSMSLLHFLVKAGYTVSVCHVHHGLRETAARDAELVSRFCNERSLPVRIVYADVRKRVSETGETVEEAARVLRYEALFEACREEKADALALAHHRDDQAETMLFQMLRGSGLKGLAGMSAKTVRTGEAPSVIRPFLGVGREEIRAYAAEEGLPWCEDETNESDEATRNRIRHHVIPVLREIRPDAVEKIAAAGAFAGEADRYFRKEAERFLDGSGNPEAGPAIAVRKTSFRSLEQPLNNYVIFGVLSRLGVPLKDVGHKHVEALAGLFSNATGAEISLPGGGYGCAEHDRVVFSKTKEDYQRFLQNENGRYRMETRVFPYEKGMEIPENCCRKWFDYDRIKNTPILRTPEPGDWISTGETGGKPLRRFLIDQWVPKAARESIQVVADGNHILWVAGIRMGAEYRITKNTKRILEIKLQPEDEKNE